MFLDNHHTTRLRFRKLTPADKAPLMEFFTDAIATQFLFISTTPEAYADAWVARQFSRYKLKTGGLMAIELLDTGELIGQCGLLLQWVDHIPKWEVGYHFLRRFWGQGYASEAARAFRDFGFEEGMAETIISLIHPDNHRSQAVARRNDMTPWKETQWKENPVVVYRIRREDWERK